MKEIPSEILENLDSCGQLVISPLEKAASGVKFQFEELVVRLEDQLGEATLDLNRLGFTVSKLLTVE